MDVNDKPVRILTDVVVNFDESNMQQVQNALGMIVKDVQQTYSATHDTGIIKLSEELGNFRSPLLTDLERNDCLRVADGQDIDDPLSPDDFVAHSTVLYARTQQASALFKTFETSNQVLYDFPSATMCAHAAAAGKLTEIYVSAIGTNPPLDCTVEKFLRGDKAESRVYEINGVCIYQLSRGNYVKHDHNRCCYVCVPDMGRNVYIVCLCEGCCPDQDSGNVEALRCLRPMLREADGSDSDDDGGGNQKPTRRERITETAVTLLRAFIDEKQLKKDSSYVYMPRENYQWDYMYAVYEGTTMDFNGLINQAERDVPELATLIHGGGGNGANLWLHDELVKAVRKMDMLLPRLRRNRNYYGFEDGLMCIEDRDGPCTKWIRWDEAQLLDIVVRVYVEYRIENKQPLYDLLVDGKDSGFAEIELLAPQFIQMLTDQGFDEIKYTWPGAEYESKLTDLYCGELGRLLYELHKHDQFRHMLAPWGKTSTGKSAAVDTVVQAFFAQAKLHQVTSNTEEIFGLAHADEKELIVIPDAEPRNRGFGISKSNFKLAVANEAVSIAIKGKDAKPAVVLHTPFVSTSNDEVYKVFGPFQNEADEQAVKARILSIHYTKAFAGGRDQGRSWRDSGHHHPALPRDAAAGSGEQHPGRLAPVHAVPAAAGRRL